MAKYFITGGAGFIGSHVAKRLVGQGQDVVIYDNLLTGNKENLKEVQGSISFLEGDVRDQPALLKGSNGCDYILHFAALPSVPLSVAEPFLTHEINLTGTLNVLLAAKANKARRVVFASSSAVYGDLEPGKPKQEFMPPRPQSPYGTHKVAGEFYLKTFFENYGLETVSLRFFNIFGPCQDPNSPYSAVISIFIDRSIKGLSPVVHGDGLQSRDFTYVANVVDACECACNADAAGVAGKVFNIGCGVSINLLELLEALGTSLGKDLLPEFTESRPGDIKHSWADISLARKHLGYEPRTDFPNGLKETVAYFRGIV